MLRLLSDECFSEHIVSGLFQRVLGLELVRVREVGLGGQPDPVVLQWAAEQNRIVLSGDRSTLSDAAWERVRQGQFMPGVFLLRRGTSVRDAIDALEMMVAATEQAEWINRVEYIPY